jgi:hypothetical protein
LSSGGWASAPGEEVPWLPDCEHLMILRTGQRFHQRYRGVSFFLLSLIGVAHLACRTGSLELFLSQEIGIDPDASISYLSDGRRLTNNNIRELGSVQDGVCQRYNLEVSLTHSITQYIFVFNKQYLEYDLEEILKLLRVEPVFQPTIEGQFYHHPTM